MVELEENIEDVIIELAKNILQDDNNNIPSDVKEKAIEKVEKKLKKGDKESNGKKETKESSIKRIAG